MSIMKEVNDYLKKGAIILVVGMLLAIPNLHVYSSIGSYQTKSKAITANKNHQLFEITNCYGQDVLVAAALPAKYSVDIARAFAKFMVRDYHAYDCSLPKQVMKNYAKYDFSGFDN